jgi:penicillin-binding protein 1A
VARTAQRLLDLENDVPRVPSIALGSIEATPVQVATMLATVANGGRRVRPGAVRLVVGSYGRVLYARDRAPEGEAVLSPACAAMVSGLLRQVVRSGTARDAGFDGIPAHGKTGTTNDHADAWFAGYAYRTTVAVWVGNDDMRVTMRGVTGGTVPARIAADFYAGIVAQETRRRARTTVASR